MAFPIYKVSLPILSPQSLFVSAFSSEITFHLSSLYLSHIELAIKMLTIPKECELPEDRNYFCLGIPHSTMPWVQVLTQLYNLEQVLFLIGVSVSMSLQQRS